VSILAAWHDGTSCDADFVVYFSVLASGRIADPTSVLQHYVSVSGPSRDLRERQDRLGIPVMSISHSDLMPISSERSDAGLYQCETVIDIRQEVRCFSFFS
jgi:hypothetical protein